MIVVTIGYSVYMAYHYYRLKKQGGALIKEYNHRSSVKTVAYVLIVLGVFYLAMFLMEKDKTAAKIFTMLLFLYFIAIVAFISIQKIKLFENGLYFSGKFTPYSQMKDIERVISSFLFRKVNKCKNTIACLHTVHSYMEKASKYSHGKEKFGSKK